MTPIGRNIEPLDNGPGAGGLVQQEQQKEDAFAALQRHTRSMRYGADSVMSDDGSSNLCEFGMMPLSDSEFVSLRTLIYDRFGINLTEKKRTLLVGRLQKLVRKHDFENFSQYYQYVINDSSGKALVELVDRISTNHTAFFRESAHFDFLRETALPETVERHRQTGNRDLRIWSAGCATGEEAYTLVMVMMEFFGMEYANWNAGLLATDISPEALRTASAGTYSEERVESIPASIRRKYVAKGENEKWIIKQNVRSEITFRRFNLMNPQLPFKKQFDLIFCRNVMIYFDQPTKDALIHRLAGFTAPGGYLFIGHSESLERKGCPYQFVKPAVYRKDVL